MKNKSNNGSFWIKAVRSILLETPPPGWIVIEGIKGAGVQLLPSDPAYLDQNCSGEVHDLVGPYKVVFEVFRLGTSGNIKISARVAAVETQPLFHEFNGIARALGCPKPKGSKKGNTQSVAAWPADSDRQSFAVTDHEEIAGWVRAF
jgi:hypothetical protein